MGSKERHQGLKRKFPGEGPDNIPPGWLDCPAYGQEIGCIIPSKTPLGESFNHYIPGKTYSPKQVIYQQRLLGRELGLVIDLTNTNRYYPTSDWREEGIDYVKIKCKGRNSVPDNASVSEFVKKVIHFLSEQTHSKKYILVHCTHGHNRTGYMIVNFLVVTEMLSVTEAIEKFARARYPGIYKQDYIDALYMCYNESKPKVFVCPQTPEWKTDLIVGGPVPDQENFMRNDVMTNDDVLGDAVPFEQLQTLRQFCYEALKLSVGTRGKLQFPGSHPVSLNRDNLQLLRQRYYYATWKADGTRYMMLITWDGCYLIDRKFHFRRVQMRFPCRSTNEGIEQDHDYTLLDGEMIIDTDRNTGQQERRYLIYDMMAINHKSVVELPFHERWEMIEREVVEPRKREILSRRINPHHNYESEPFSVRRKGFWLLSTVPKLLKKFIPELSHESDGLIFQGWDDPYVPRTHEGLLKWKYAEMNSVDFLFEMGFNKFPQLFLYERGKKKLMGGFRVVFNDASDPSLYSGKIIECSWSWEEKVWVCMRIRTDKSTPNELNTYNKVMRSIEDNITEDVLLNNIDEIIHLPMYADRIQLDIRAHQRSIRHK